MEDRSINVNLRSGDQPRVIYPGERRSFPPAPSLSSSSVEKPAEREISLSAESKFITKAFEKIIDVALFMIFFGFPLFFTGLSAQGAIFEKQLYFYFWILLGLIAWTAKSVTTGELKIRRTPLDIPIIGFWIAYLLSTFFSVDRWHSFWGAYSDPSRGLMSITALVVAYYLIFSNYNARRIKLMLGAVIGAGSIISIWTMLAVLNIKFLPDSIAQYAPISLSGSMLGVAIITCALIPLIMMAILKIGESDFGRKIFGKVVNIVLLAILALNIFLTLTLYNFVPFLALFIGVGIFLVFILSQIVRPRSSWAWLPMLVFILVMAVKMIGVVPIAKINFAEVKPLDTKPSVEIMKESAKNKPFLGSGPATFGYDFSLFRPQDFNSNMLYNVRFLQGTGMVMEYVPTIGVVGAFFFVIILLSYLSVELYLVSREKEKNKLLALGLFSAAIIFLVSVTITKVEGTTLVMAFLVSVLALVAVLKESQSEEKFISLSLKASPKYALALAFVFMVVSAGVAFLFVFLGKIYAADMYAGKAARVTATNKEESLTNMGQAIRLYPQEGKYYSQLGQYYMILANDEALKGTEKRDVEKIKQYINASVAATNIGKDMMKNDVGMLESVAQVYENTGLYVPDSYTLAKENYQKALELEPHNPAFYLKIGQIDLALVASQKDAEAKKQMVISAKNNFQKAVTEKADLAEGYYQLSIAENALGETDAAIESNKKAIVADNSKSTDYILSLARLLQTRGTENDMKDSEQLYKAVIAQNDQDVNAHFYLGLLFEKTKNKTGAKDEYKKVITLLPAGNDETKKQLEKMIANTDAGIENTPQSLGLTAPADQGTVAGDENTNTNTNTNTDANVGQ